jgi:NADPH:quinone reductase-like Zn-dependent oxidoreductase
MDCPALEPGKVRVEVIASMISPGTELGRAKGMRQKPNLDQAPRPFGYANAGVVDALGTGVSQYRVGQRVACMGGGYALHSDWALVPQNMCVPIPDVVSFEEAASVHLAATALHAIRRVQPLYGENGMVMGLGLVGQLSAQFGQLSGCHMMGVDRFGLRVDRACQAGVETAVNASQEDLEQQAGAFSLGYGMDFGIIAFGGDATAAFEQVYRSLKKTPDTHHMGRIIIVGGAQVTHGFGASLGNVDVRSAARTGPGYHDEDYEHGREYPRVFVEWPTQRNLSECMRAMADQRLKVKPLITHEFNLAQIGQAVDLLVEEPEKAIGVVLKP